jgi:excinuclease UvrABC ATPase subunit
MEIEYTKPGEVCKVCKGKGYITVDNWTPTGWTIIVIPCDNCDEGKKYESEVIECGVHHHLSWEERDHYSYARDDV